MTAVPRRRSLLPTRWSRVMSVGCAALLAFVAAAPVGAAVGDAPAGAADAPATPAETALLGTDASNCRGMAHVYGAMSSGTLTFTGIDARTNTRVRRFVGPSLGFYPRAMATLNHNTVLVSTSTGGLYRVDVENNATALSVAGISRLASSGWSYDKLAFDGAGHLFGTVGTNGALVRYDVTAKKPTGSQVTRPVRMGTGFALTSLTATGGSRLMGTTSSGKLMGYHVRGPGNVIATTFRSSGWSSINALASPGGGVFYGRWKDGALSGYRDLAPTDGSGKDLGTIGVVDESGWNQKVLSAAPRNVTCSTSDLTHADLVAMFGSGWVGDKSVVEAGLPSLTAEMRIGQVTTAARKAAWLATLVSESAMRYDALQPGTMTYRGRGYIQLTNDFNYDSAGDYFDIDLVGNPELARSLSYSAAIARWYWTVERTTTNAYADAHDMHGVNRNIGFAWNYEEATRRCDRFKSAYRYLTGETPTGVICYPARLPREGSTDWYVQPGD